MNKDGTLTIEEKHTVMNIIDDILGSNILDLQNSLVVERNLDKLEDDILHRAAKKIFMKAYTKVYEDEV